MVSMVTLHTVYIAIVMTMKSNTKKKVKNMDNQSWLGKPTLQLFMHTYENAEKKYYCHSAASAFVAAARC